MDKCGAAGCAPESAVGRGLSSAAYCRRQGLSSARGMDWQRRLGAAALMPRAVKTPAPVPFTARLSLPGGAVLHVSGVEVADTVVLARGLSC